MELQDTEFEYLQFVRKSLLNEGIDDNETLDEIEISIEEYLFGPNGAH